MAQSDTLYLTFDCTLMGADQMAAVDAYRAHTALGHPEEACLTAAIAAYREQHPGMPRPEAIAAVMRLFWELGLQRRRATPSRAAPQRMEQRPRRGPIDAAELSRRPSPKPPRGV